MKLKRVIFENDIETKQGDWFADLAMDIITEVKDGFEKLFSTDTDIQKYSSLNRVEINYIPGEFTKPEENFFKLRETVDVAVPGLSAPIEFDFGLVIKKENLKGTFVFMVVEHGEKSKDGTLDYSDPILVSGNTSPEEVGKKIVGWAKSLFVKILNKEVLNTEKPQKVVLEQLKTFFETKLPKQVKVESIEQLKTSLRYVLRGQMVSPKTKRVENLTIVSSLIVPEGSQSYVSLNISVGSVVDLSYRVNFMDEEDYLKPLIVNVYKKLFDKNEDYLQTFMSLLPR